MNSEGSSNNSLDGSIEENDFLYLSASCIKNITDKTHFKENEIKTFHEAFLKDFPKGRLNRKEFFKIYKQCDSNEADHNSFCNHIFRAFDQDNDGFISFSEFFIGVSMPTAPNTKRDLKNKLRWLFKIYDINGDGLVEKYEFQDVIESFYQLLSGNTTNLKVQAVIHSNEIFEKFDIDKKMFITIDQFTESCLEDYNLLNLLAPSYTRKL